MTAPPDSQAALDRALRGVHRSVLVTLAVCAGVIAASAEPVPAAGAADVPRGFAHAATALAAVAILTRRRRAAGANPRGHVALSLASLLSACGVGIVGVAAALAGTPRTTALVYALAGAIFALRPPQPIAARPPAERA
jgi:hypothetical protein